MKKICFLIFVLFFSGIGTLTAQYSILLNFNDTNGAGPTGNLINIGSVLYGMTPSGGANVNTGLIFSINTNGSGYRDLHNFYYTSGDYPLGSLVQYGKGLYGMTEYGGTNQDGVIFSIDTNGNGYKILHNFNDTIGANPYGSLIISGSTLYGMTENGGAKSDGIIFSIDTDGSGYKDLYDFNKPTGSAPHGSLMLSGNVLYGMTSLGGVFDSGCIFSFNLDGNTYKDIHDFNGTMGQNPEGDLIIHGSNLYGMATDGGKYGLGCIFSIDTNGSGFSDMFDYNSIFGGVTNGCMPEGSLTFIGNKLYGMTVCGGYGDGNIFCIDTNGSGFSVLHNFNVGTDDASQPYGSLILYGSNLYGMTKGKGAGVIFEIDTTSLTSIHNLSVVSVTLKLYPDPNDGIFTISMQGVTGASQIEIYNMLGQRVYENKLNSNNTEINHSGQPAGIYLYRVVSENGECLGSGKMVIEK